MTSYLPPSDRIWWNVPVGKQEIVWIGIALIWCLIMFFMMPYWHIYGKQNLSNEKKPAFQLFAHLLAAMSIFWVDCGSGIPFLSLKPVSRIVCISPQWTGSMVSPCSR